MHFLSPCFQGPMAIHPATGRALRASAFAMGPEVFQSKAAKSEKPMTMAPSREGTVAVLSVGGQIVQSATLINEFFCEILGGCITQNLDAQFSAAMADPTVSAILLKVNSPGGEAFGVDALAAKIAAARGTKPVIAHVDGMAASGAYWLASACDGIYCTEASCIGCIGTVMSWLNDDALMESLGIKEVEIVSECSPNKRPDESTPEGLAVYQADVNQHGMIFVGAVAKNRGVKVSDVLANYGQGWTKFGNDALAAGMVDGVMPFEKVMSALQEGRSLPKYSPPATDGARGKNMKNQSAIAAAFHGLGVALGVTAPQVVPAAPESEDEGLLDPSVSAIVGENMSLKTQLAQAQALLAANGGAVQQALANRRTAFVSSVARKIPPANLKSASNPNGYDAESQFDQAHAGGFLDTLESTFAAMGDNPMLTLVPSPKRTEMEARAGGDTEKTQAQRDKENADRVMANAQGKNPSPVINKEAYARRA